MVSTLLALRARLDVTVNTACDGNESYRYKLKEAWEGFLNARCDCNPLADMPKYCR